MEELVGRISHPVLAFLPVLGVNLLVGLPAYFFVALLAYGFRDPIRWHHHVLFVVLIALYALVTGLVVLIAAIAEPEAMAGQLLAFGAYTSLALNGTVLAIGSIVSAAHAADDSFTAAFPWPVDVLVVVVLLAAVVCFLRAAGRTRAAARSARPAPADAR